MLVLSRRENQKILFPSLGISIEVVRANTKNVQLGIDAPKEIRVMRAELVGEAEAAEHGSHCPGTARSTSDDFHESIVRRQLDDASLAIRLAQNQMAAGRNESAELALDQAISRLQEMKGVLVNQNDVCGSRTYVHEQKSNYHVSNTGQVGKSELMGKPGSIEKSGHPNSLASIVDESISIPLAV